MPPCTLSADLDGSTACPPDAPGIDETAVWLTNRANITFTGSSNNTYTDFTMASGTELYRWKFHNKGMSYSEEYTENETTGAGSWAQSLNGRILSLSGANASKIMSLRGTDLVAIFRTKAGKFLVAGSRSEGLRLKANTTGTEADTLGESITLGNDESPDKYWQYLDTDAATSLAALIAAETAV